MELATVLSITFYVIWTTHIRIQRNSFEHLFGERNTRPPALPECPVPGAVDTRAARVGQSGRLARETIAARDASAAGNKRLATFC